MLSICNPDKCKCERKCKDILFIFSPTKHDVASLVLVPFYSQLNTKINICCIKKTSRRTQKWSRIGSEPTPRHSSIFLMYVSHSHFFFQTDLMTRCGCSEISDPKPRFQLRIAILGGMSHQGHRHGTKPSVMSLTDFKTRRILSRLNGKREGAVAEVTG